MSAHGVDDDEIARGDRERAEGVEGRRAFLDDETVDVSGGDRHELDEVVTTQNRRVRDGSLGDEELRAREETLRAIVREVEGLFPGARIRVDVKESYRNMAYKIGEDPKVLEYAFEAVRRMGLEPVRRAIRGGTDGARLSFIGLLTPNIWAGGQSFHSVQEWVSLEWMVKAGEVTLHLLQVWVERSAA
jgi:tripeptide aminopeptidase